MMSYAPKNPIKEANRITTLLKKVLGSERFPVDVKQVALEISKYEKDPIAKVVGDNLPGFEGMLSPHKRRPAWHIVYNDDPRYRGRTRFTIAHELGHYLLHRPHLSDADYISGQLQKDLSITCSPMQSHKWKEEERKREKEADIFASYLLMPIDDYRQQVDGQEMSAELLDHITDRYGVSLTAACLKWIEFTDRRAAMIVARDGFALWGRASTSAIKSGILIPSGMQIPEEALVSKNTKSSGFIYRRSIFRPAGIWKFNSVTEPVQELALVSNTLDYSITILQFGKYTQIPGLDEEQTPDLVDLLNKQVYY